MRANGSLARDAIVVSEACAFSSASVTSSLVGALDDRVGVISVDGVTNPGGGSNFK